MSTSLHHLALACTDMRASSAFYDRLLAPLGYRRDHDTAELITWIGPTPEILLYRASLDRPQHALGAPGWHHAAFEVSTRDLVERVYDVLSASGSKVLIPPAEYPEYGSGYFAVFFEDPDGLKIEIAFIPRGLDD